MSISFRKLEQILSNRNMTHSDLRRDRRGDGKGLHPSVLSKVFNGGKVNVDTINNICEMLDCQPGDIMEYIKD